MQAIIASAFARRDYSKVISSTSRVLQVFQIVILNDLFAFCALNSLNLNNLITQLGLILGLVLSFLLFSLLPFASKLFTNDINVLQLISITIPVSNVAIAYKTRDLSPSSNILVSQIERVIYFSNRFLDDYLLVCSSHSTHQCASICF